MTGRLHIAASFLRTLVACRPGRSRAGFEAWQQRQLTTWLRRDLPHADFYRGLPPRLDALPVIDKATVMARFEAFNRSRITAEDGWRALETGGRLNGISLGASTGTSGNRGLYAITEAERYRWLGSILAKTIPAFLFRPERVAILLPQGSALYDSATDVHRLRLRFFDLRQGIDSWLGALEAFDPTTIVAPPRVLRHLAETSARLAPRRIFAGAETLDPVDRTIVEGRFGLKLGQIYMATEGLFGVTCQQGRLHLAEDANVFEFEPVTGGLVTPLITGFRRDFQIMARYRMNDLLRLSPDPCPCGSPLRGVDEVIGRMDDVFEFKRADGKRTLVTPDILRNAVLDAAREITDFRIRQEVDGSVTLVLEPDLGQASVAAARMALGRVFERQGLAPGLTVSQEKMPLESSRKLRRVECRLQKGEPS